MPQETPRLFVALYTDADVTADLAPAVRRRGYQAQSAAEAGNLTLSDEAQLCYATDHGMAILTYNAQDFIPVARAWDLAGRGHTGIILSEQFSQRQFGELLRQVLQLLNRVTADEMHTQIVFLQRFRRSRL
jgi:predicted nuclease of predicted toxin-antitoxin system